MLRHLYGLGLACFATLMAACAAPSEGDETDATEAAATATTHFAADPRATPETETVLANLRSFDFQSSDPFDHRVLIGQQEANVSNRSTYGTSPVTSDIERVANKAPGLVSYELSSAYPNATSMFDVDAFRQGRDALRRLILDQHKKGVLVSLVWHMRCPKTAGDRDRYSPSECPADYTMSELLERKANGQPGAHFHEWRAILDELAELLWSLKDEHGKLVPVQIRPFHELTGNWFWWGSQNDPSVYAAAWREMVSYLRDGRGLHNTLWVFCPAAPSDTGLFASFYPGDAFVDVIAFDRYDLGSGFDRGYASDLRVIGGFAKGHKKVAAVAEVGRDLLHQSASPDWFSRSMLEPLKHHSFAYVALWRNAPWEKFIPEPTDGATAADFASMSRDDGALFAGKHDLYRLLHVETPPP